MALNGRGLVGKSQRGAGREGRTLRVTGRARSLGADPRLKTLDDVAWAMGAVKLMTLAPFNLNIDVDPKNPNAYAIFITQSGLGMPNRDYYLRDDKAIVETREAYKKYLATMLGMAGLRDAQKRADQVYAVELKIAKAQWPNEDRRDVDKTYNPMTVSALEQLAPQFSWKKFLGAAGVALTSPHGERQVIVAEKSAFPKLAAIFAATPVSVWRDYLTVHYLHQVAPYLPKKFDDSDFAKLWEGTGRVFLVARPHEQRGFGSRVGAAQERQPLRLPARRTALRRAQPVGWRH